VRTWPHVNIAALAARKVGVRSASSYSGMKLE
jgi:hypothetical protein